jgi:hypothetical protein
VKRKPEGLFEVNAVVAQLYAVKEGDLPRRTSRKSAAMKINVGKNAFKIDFRKSYKYYSVTKLLITLF